MYTYLPGSLILSGSIPTSSIQNWEAVTSSYSITSSYAMNGGGASAQMKIYLPDALPVEVHYLNDEFTGSVLGSKWTRTGALLCSESISNSWAVFSLGSAAGTHYTQPTASDNTYRIVGRFGYHGGFSGNRSIGIVLWNRAGSRGESFNIGWFNGGYGITIDMLTGNPPITWNSRVAQTNLYFAGGINSFYLSVAKELNTGNMYYQWSYDGNSWMDYVTGRTTGSWLNGAVTDFGIIFDSDGTTSGSINYWRYTGSIDPKHRLAGREVTINAF